MSNPEKEQRCGENVAVCWQRCTTLPLSVELRILDPIGRLYNTSASIAEVNRYGLFQRRSAISPGF